MDFNRNHNKPVIALLGAGSMGCAIAKRIGANKTILLGDISEKNLEERARELRASGYIVETQKVDACDVSSVRAFAQKVASLGAVRYLLTQRSHLPIRQRRDTLSNLTALEPPLPLTNLRRSLPKAALVLSFPARRDI